MSCKMQNWEQFYKAESVKLDKLGASRYKLTAGGRKQKLIKSCLKG